jgi:quinol monooxygenase YgiN
VTEEPVTVVIVYRAQPGKHDVASRRLAALVETVVAREAGCLGIAMCQDPADPARFLLYERWSDRAIYLGPHMNTPHLLQFIGQAEQFLAGPPRISLWHEVLDARPPSARGGHEPAA